MTEEKFFAKVCNEIVILSYKSTENNLEMIEMETREENIKKINAELEKVTGGKTGKLVDFDSISGIGTEFHPNKLFKFEIGK